MTTTFNISQVLSSTRKQGAEDARLYLLLLLLGLLTLFFAFWTPATRPAYSKKSLKSKTVTTSNKIVKADPATIYKGIVTKGDAIRSVLQ